MAGNTLANLLGKVNASNALVVTIDGGAIGPVDSLSFSGGSSLNGATTNTLKLRATGTTDILTLTTSAVTSSVPILGPDGSASAPSYSFASRTNAGLKSDSADTFDLVAAGSNMARVSSTTGFIINSARALAWGSSDVGTPDVSLSRVAANDLGLNGSLSHTGANGQVFKDVQALTELTTIASAATTDTTIQMPANSVVLAVSVRVTTVIPTAATFTVGDSGSAARFSTAAVSTAANSTDSGTKAGAYYNASALSIRITPNLTPAANTGRVRTTIYFYTVTPPSS